MNRKTRAKMCISDTGFSECKNGKYTVIVLVRDANLPRATGMDTIELTGDTEADVDFQLCEWVEKNHAVCVKSEAIRLANSFDPLDYESTECAA